MPRSQKNDELEKSTEKNYTENNEPISKLKKKLSETRIERSASSKLNTKKKSEKEYNIYQSQRNSLEQNRLKDLEITHERLKMVAK